MIKAVFFDLDGTLVDTAPDLAAALNQVRINQSLPPLPFATLRPVTSQGARGLLRVGFGIEPTHPDYDVLQNEFLQHYENNICVHSSLFEGMKQVLSHIETLGLPWGVVTNKRERFTLPLMAALGLKHRAACIVSGDSTPVMKPAPEPMFLACKLAGIAPGDCIYVGDDERDIQAGRAAGMAVVAAGYGYLGENSQPQSWNADHLIQHPSELISLLEKLI